ncbi:MAG TPA: translation elongation factor Ts [Chloroflexota bacterium]|nr:translation elongation factor Ts [Chloroflexota bacterium]
MGAVGEQGVAVETTKIKQLRDETGAPVMDCKRALEEANGDLVVAKEKLRDRGAAIAEKKAGRVAAQGMIDSYIHGGGRIGVLVEVNCETDFVARNDDFRRLVHDIAMQIAATNPRWIGNEEDAPSEYPEGELPLLQQPFIRDEHRTVQSLVHEAIGKLGENLVVRRFSRYELGS